MHHIHAVLSVLTQLISTPDRLNLVEVPVLCEYTVTIFRTVTVGISSTDNVEGGD